MRKNRGENDFQEKVISRRFFGVSLSLTSSTFLPVSSVASRLLLRKATPFCRFSSPVPLPPDPSPSISFWRCWEKRCKFTTIEAARALFREKTETNKLSVSFALLQQVYLIQHSLYLSLILLLSSQLFYDKDTLLFVFLLSFIHSICLFLSSFLLFHLA